MDRSNATSRLIGPEDVVCGDYVTIAETTYEFVNDCGSIIGDDPKVVRATFWADDAGQPLKVEAVSLPFVLVKDSRGDHRALDLRRYRLARLPQWFGKLAFKRLAGKG